MKINDINENILVAFIDTSVLDPMHNDYSNMEHLFVALKKHVESNKIILLTHEIVIDEIKSHINKEVTAQLDKLQNLQTAKEFVLIKNKKEYQAIFQKLEKNNIITETEKQFLSKLKELGVNIIKTGNISVKQLLEDYFSAKPPFGSKDKKSEFPDAIMLQSIKKNLQEDDKIHIIAKDGDWDNVCKNNKGFVLHKSINTFLDYINKDNDASVAIKTYLCNEEIKKEINKALYNIIENIDFKVDGKKYDRKGLIEGFEYDENELLEISNVEFFLNSIEDIDCSETTENTSIRAILTILGSAYLTFRCTSFDEYNSPYDNESHEYLIKNYNYPIETHEFLFPVRLIISGDYRKELKILEYNLIKSKELSLLDNATLIRRKFETEYEENYFCVKKILQCPNCKKDINVDLMTGDTVCVGTYERQMGDEHEYDVDIYDCCPYCGQEYQITGKIWEYPELVCNLEQNIEIKKA